MKANNGTGNTIERDVWQTPQKLWDQLNRQYDFKFDCCADDNNSKCEVWSSDFLYYDEAFIGESHWINPPFSKAYEMLEHFFKVVGQGVAIYRCDNMETKIWQDVILKNATWVLIPPKRICYEGFEGNGARFASALIGFNVEPPKEIKGKILLIHKKEKPL